jgi:hypothetical protein
MVVRWITAVRVRLVAPGAAQTAAHTGEVSDPRPSAGSRDSRRLVLDNTADRVGVTAVPAVDFVAALVSPELATQPYREG